MTPHSCYFLFFGHFSFQVLIMFRCVPIFELVSHSPYTCVLSKEYDIEGSYEYNDNNRQLALYKINTRITHN